LNKYTYIYKKQKQVKKILNLFSYFDKSPTNYQKINF
jgi:hypothetical protein